MSDKQTEKNEKEVVARIQLAEQLTKIVQQLQNQKLAENVAGRIDAVLKRNGVSWTDLNIRLEKPQLSFTEQMMLDNAVWKRRQEYWYGITWQQFLNLVSRKVDVRQTWWRRYICDRTDIDMFTLQFAEENNSVRRDTIEQVEKLPDNTVPWEGDMPTTNLADAIPDLLLALGDRSPQWVAKQLTAFLAEYNGMKVWPNQVSAARTALMQRTDLVIAKKKGDKR